MYKKKTNNEKAEKEENNNSYTQTNMHKRTHAIHKHTCARAKGVYNYRMKSLYYILVIKSLKNVNEKTYFANSAPSILPEKN